MTEDVLSRWAGQAFSLGLACAVLLLLAEGWWLRATARGSLARRWLANALTLGATLFVLSWLPALSLMGAALLAEHRGWGLLNAWPAPAWSAVAVGVLAIDLTGYLAHRLEHLSPLLWRIHRLHHSDPDVDVTTTYRFHPLEVLLRAGAQVLVAIAVGVPPVAAAGYLLLSSVTSALSHANLRLPRGLDRALGLVVITPGIHRTHHSIDSGDANSNFSVCLSCWDRIFGTFRKAPTLGHAAVRFGVEGRSDLEATSILTMLVDPFVAKEGPDGGGSAGTSSRGGTNGGPAIS